MSENSDELRVHGAEEAAVVLRRVAGWLDEQSRQGGTSHLLLVATGPPRVAWTADEAAGLLGCTASWLREKARRREIPYTMLGGAYHFSGAHLAAVMSTFEELPRSGRAAAAHTPRTPRRSGARGASAEGEASALAARARLRRAPRPSEGRVAGASQSTVATGAATGRLADSRGAYSGCDVTACSEGRRPSPAR